MRRYVKLIVLTVTAAAVLIALAAVNGARADRYSRELRDNYIRALTGLAESVSAIDIELHKCICSGTTAGFAENAALVWADSQRGKVHLSELPTQNGELDGIERFLAQAGDYVISTANDEELTLEQYEQLIELSEYAAVLRIALEDILSGLNNGEEWEQLISNNEIATVNRGVAASGLRVAGEAMKDYPTMIYDGPYSDHVFERKPALVADMEELSEKKASEKAELFSGKQVYYSGTSENVIGEYIFTSADKNTEIAVTKRGGIVSYMLRDADIGEQRFSVEQAGNAAEKFMKKIGWEDFVGISYNTYAGICVFSYAPMQDNIVLYPDQIKVSVALDCGDIIAYDARDYIMNHADRGLLSAKKTRMQAQECVSSMLTVSESRLVLIQTEGLSECVCYEFFCRRWDGGEAAVYINADTLREEKIYLLSRTDDCFLAV